VLVEIDGRLRRSCVDPAKVEQITDVFGELDVPGIIAHNQWDVRLFPRVTARPTETPCEADAARIPNSKRVKGSM
jgi:hypothetical protein